MRTTHPLVPPLCFASKGDASFLRTVSVHKIVNLINENARQVLKYALTNGRTIVPHISPCKYVRLNRRKFSYRYSLQWTFLVLQAPLIFRRSYVLFHLCSFHAIHSWRFSDCASFSQRGHTDLTWQNPKAGRYEFPRVSPSSLSSSWPIQDSQQPVHRTPDLSKRLEGCRCPPLPEQDENPRETDIGTVNTDFDAY